MMGDVIKSRDPVHRYHLPGDLARARVDPYVDIWSTPAGWRRSLADAFVRVGRLRHGSMVMIVATSDRSVMVLGPGPIVGWCHERDLTWPEGIAW